jgi:predicted 2-oxoglutarate/Fe(II)-dependent dioxygenase YbiX
MQKIEDYIHVVPDVLSKEELAQIRTALEKSSLWVPAGAKTDGAAKDVRNCYGMSLSQTKDKPQELAVLDSILFNAASKALKEYIEKIAPRVIVQIDTGYDALRYTEGGFYRTHVDHFPEQHRTLSCSIAINDDYEGGEWDFWDGETKIKIPAGSAILFPSNFMYPHQILPVTKGTRYSIITWFV